VDSQRPLPRPPERRGYANGSKPVRRVPLVNSESCAVETVAQAIAELNRLRTHRADETLPVLGRTPADADFAKNYLDPIKVNKDKK
jgi:hypothetical protein